MVPALRSDTPSAFRTAVWRLITVLLCACGLQALLAAPSGALLVHAANGNLASFAGGVNAQNATFTAVGGGYGPDKQSFEASDPGGASSPTAYGALSVNWTAGQSVAYGAAFRLPQTFHSATSGQQLLLSWTSAQGSDGNTQQGGVAINYANNTGYLVTNTTSPFGLTTTQQVLAGPFTLPTGQWFTLQVRQLLSSSAPAQSGVYVNGRLVASATAPDFSEQQINQVDYGIVQLSGGAEQGSAWLKLDRAFAGVFTSYLNPLQGDRYISGRTDMGVDFCLKRGEPIYALGDGVVAGISRDWFLGQPYIWYQLLDGPYAGRFVYVAEQIRALPAVGSWLNAGQTIALYKRYGTCIETGWSAGDGATTAQATTGYHEGQVTKAGVAFARFLTTLGVQGRFELKPTHAPRIPAFLGWTQNPWTEGP